MLTSSVHHLKHPKKAEPVYFIWKKYTFSAIVEMANMLNLLSLIDKS